MDRPKTIDVTAGEYVGALASIFLMGTLLGWGLFSGGGWIEALASSNNAAEWVQGIGSLVGIAIAIYVPWKQRQVQDRRQARVVAARVRAPLESWIDCFSAFDESIDRSDEKPPNGDLVWIGSRNDSIFGASETIENQIDQLYLLGTGGDRIFDAMRKAHEARESCRMLIQRFGDSEQSCNYESAGNQMQGIWDRYYSIQNDIGEALDVVVELL